MSSESYRPDIDGLRAIAVIAVIVNHFNKEILPSGFLGVDIFFVISGYVITASIIRKDRMSFKEMLLDFYSRRIKRLVPALAVLVLITSLAICLFDPNAYKSLKTGIFSLIGISNFYLYKESIDYFGSSAQLNPFTHTWSLGVEEQFYFLFPILMWVLNIDNRSSLNVRKANLIIGLLSILSFASYILLMIYRPQDAYFLMPTRFWELSSGTLLFFSMRRSRIKWLNPDLALICLVSILFIPLRFVIYTTPAVVMFTLMLIYTLKPGYISYQLLISKIPNHIGKISYSLYLWHWAVIVLSRWTIGIHLWTLPFQFLTIWLLTEASYKFIEKPFRHAVWSPSKGRTIACGLSFIASMVIVLTIVNKTIRKSLFSGTKAVLIAEGGESLSQRYQIHNTNFVWSGEECILSKNDQLGKEILSRNCTLGDLSKSKQRILVVGNSYSAAFVQAFDKLVTEDNFAVTITSTWGASIVPEIPNTTSWNLVNDHYWSKVVPKLISELASGDTVFLLNDMQSLSPQKATPDSVHTLKKLEFGLNKLSLQLSKKGTTLAVLNSGPFIREANCEPVTAMNQWFSPNGGPCLYFSRKVTLERRKDLTDVLVKLEKSKRIKIIDLFDVFCHGNLCTYKSKNDQLLYRDVWSHPSVEAAILSAAHIRRELKK